MSNRTDFDALARELVAMFGMDPDAERVGTGKLLWRLERELHNAFVAGQGEAESLRELVAKLEDEVAIHYPGCVKAIDPAVLRGLADFADVADCEGQLDSDDARAALEWLKANAGGGVSVHKPSESQCARGVLTGYANQCRCGCVSGTPPSGRCRCGCGLMAARHHRLVWRARDTDRVGLDLWWNTLDASSHDTGDEDVDR